MNENYGTAQAAGQISANHYAEKLAMIATPRTIGENIDSRIAMHESEIARLRGVKAQLSDGTPLLNIRIDDLRQAMNY